MLYKIVEIFLVVLSVTVVVGGLCEVVSIRK